MHYLCGAIIMALIIYILSSRMFATRCSTDAARIRSSRRGSGDLLRLGGRRFVLLTVRRRSQYE